MTCWSCDLCNLLWQEQVASTLSLYVCNSVLLILYYSTFGCQINIIIFIISPGAHPVVLSFTLLLFTRCHPVTLMVGSRRWPEIWRLFRVVSDLSPLFASSWLCGMQWSRHSDVWMSSMSSWWDGRCTCGHMATADNFSHVQTFFIMLVQLYYNVFQVWKLAWKHAGPGEFLNSWSKNCWHILLKWRWHLGERDWNASVLQTCISSLASCYIDACL